MAEVLSPSDARIDLVKLDDFRVTKANFDLLASYIATALHTLGFKDNTVFVEVEEAIVTGEKGRGIPYTIRIKTRAGIISLLKDFLVSSESEEPQGIRAPTFDAMLPFLAKERDAIRSINPGNVMELLRGGKVFELPPDCRIFADADAYNHALKQAHKLGYEKNMATLFFTDCFRYYCQPAPEEARDDGLEGGAAAELRAFAAAMNQGPHSTVYLYESFELTNSILLLSVPDSVPDFPLNTHELSQAETTDSPETDDDLIDNENQWSEDEDEDADGDLLELDIDREFNTELERAVAHLLARNPSLRIIQSQNVHNFLLDSYDLIAFRVSIRNVQDLSMNQIAYSYARTIFTINRQIQQQRSADNLLLIRIEGRRLVFYSVPPEEAENIPCH